MRTKITIIIILIVIAIAGVLAFQANSVLTSYKISRENRAHDIKTSFDEAIIIHKQQVADSVRRLLKQLVAISPVYNFKVSHYTSGILAVGFGYKNNGYAAYVVTDKELPAIKKRPGQFLIRKVNELDLAGLRQLYYALISPRDYGDSAGASKLQTRLSDMFRLHKDVGALKNILSSVLHQRGLNNNFKVQYFNNAFEMCASKVIINKRPHSAPATDEHFDVIPDKTFSLSSLDMMDQFIRHKNDNLNKIYIAKPLFDVEVNMIGDVPIMLLVADITPKNVLKTKEMLLSIGGSVACLFLLGLLIIFMFYVILKQKKLSDIKNDFISNVTHELKTPIATTMAAIQGMQHFDVLKSEDKTREYLNTAFNEMQRLSLMVNKILSISIFENNNETLNPVTFNLRQMLDEIITTQRIRNEKPVNISLNYNATEIVTADKTHLYNVMLNLVDNAIKYSSNAVNISIDCVNKSKGVAITVKDDGMGIPAEYQQMVFEKFFRVPDKKGYKAKGYGLGLSYVKNIIEKHKGTVTLQSQVNKGTSVTVTLP